MLSFDEYADRFENVAITRSESGVITLRLHTGGGAFVYGAAAHAELPFALRCVADDVANRVVVLTGTGDSFWLLLNPPSFSHLQHTPSGWDQTLFEERRTLEAFLSIDVPIISAVNGPALVHSHLPVMADIVLASETARFADALHAPAGIVARRRCPHDLDEAAGAQSWPVLPVDRPVDLCGGGTRSRGGGGGFAPGRSDGPG